MKKVLLSLLGLAGLHYSIYAQVSGNEAYGNLHYNKSYNNNYYYQNNPPQNNQYYQNMLVTDSTYFIQAKILMNVQPDHYIVTFSVQEEELTVKDCNIKINDRIKKFKESLKTLNIKDEDIYVDMVAQARIYDYKVAGRTATQTETGYELKKNIIIKFYDITQIDDMLVFASEQDIYDIVKVDYIVEDQQKIYDQMIAEAAKLIDHKKSLANGMSKMVFLPDYKLCFQNFFAVYPDEAYKSYSAFETSDANYHYGYNSSESYWKKEMRKTKTFYYDKMNYSGFDKVINPSYTRIPVQFVLDVQMKYSLKCDNCPKKEVKVVVPEKKEK